MHRMIGASAALSLSPVAGAGSHTKAMETIAALSAARQSRDPNESAIKLLL